MKKIILFSVALLCLAIEALAQSEFITFPTEGSVFQANSSGNYYLTFDKKIKNPNKGRALAYS